MHGPCFIACSALWEQAQLKICLLRIGKTFVGELFGFGVLGAIQRKKPVSISEYQKGTLWRYLQSYILSGNVDSQVIGRQRDSVQFQTRKELVIMEAVSEKPTVTLNEIFEEIYRSTGSEFALSSIHYYIKRNVITRKKVINVPELDCLIN